MLPTGEHVLAVWQRARRPGPPGTLLIDCSTIDVDSARKAHALADGAGLCRRSTRRSPAASAGPRPAR